MYYPDAVPYDFDDDERNARRRVVSMKPGTTAGSWIRRPPPPRPRTRVVDRRSPPAQYPAQYPPQYPPQDPYGGASPGSPPVPPPGYGYEMPPDYGFDPSVGYGYDMMPPDLGLDFWSGAQVLYY